MNKEFISYKEALKLKKIGFDEECFCIFIGEDKELIPNIGTRFTNSFFEQNKSNLKKITAPTYQQIFRWFRDKHSLYVNLKTYTNPNEILGIEARYPNDFEVLKKYIK